MFKIKLSIQQLTSTGGSVVKFLASAFRFFSSFYLNFNYHHIENKKKMGLTGD